MDKNTKPEGWDVADVALSLVVGLLLLGGLGEPSPAQIAVLVAILATVLVALGVALVYWARRK